MYSQPKLLQGVFRFEGHGLASPHALSDTLTYTVPMGRRAQTVYFRAGNSAADMIYIVLLRDGQPMRYFPIGARGDVHVALAVVEDLPAGTTLAAHLAAPEGISGTVVLDIGLVEI